MTNGTSYTVQFPKPFPPFGLTADSVLVKIYRQKTIPQD